MLDLLDEAADMADVGSQGELTIAREEICKGKKKGMSNKWAAGLTTSSAYLRHSREFAGPAAVPGCGRGPSAAFLRVGPHASVALTSVRPVAVPARRLLLQRGGRRGVAWHRLTRRRHQAE